MIVTTTCLSILEALELLVIMYVCTMKITWLMAVLKYIIPFGKVAKCCLNTHCFERRE